MIECPECGGAGVIYRNDGGDAISKKKYLALPEDQRYKDDCERCDGYGQIEDDYENLITMTTMNKQDTKIERSAEFMELNTKLEQIERITLVGAKNVLTLEEVALLTGLSKGHLYRLTSTQSIPHYKPNGRNLYFKKDEIEEWLLQNRVSTLAEIDSKATTYTAIKK
jgi:excisionase family DNA binding protein